MSGDATARHRTPVWIDTDTAIGVPGADVDDGLALVQAFRSPELTLRGVSAVFGNAPLLKTFPIAREVCERFGPPGLPVHEGAASAGELGSVNDAVRALADALRAEPLTVIALGPLTNVAGVVLRFPELAGRMRAVVAVAARRPGQRFRSLPEQPVCFPDLNFDCDPPAMLALIDAGVPLEFAPWEVSSHVWIEGEDLDRLESSGGAGAWIAEQSRPWLEIWQRDLKAPGFNPFDTLAIARVTHPDWLESFAGGVWIEPGPDDNAPQREQEAGRTKPHLLVDPQREGPRALYCHRPAAAFKEMLLERLAG